MKYFRNASIARLLLFLACVSVAGALEWRYVESGTAIEAALYRWMPMPVSKVLGLRPPREAVPLITELIARQPAAELYSLRAQGEEAALDMKAAEADWRKYAETAADRIDAQLALAAFYHRRLRPADEVAALAVVARAPQAEKERLLAPEQQRSWLAFERTLTVIGENALPAETSERTYQAWMARYPREKSVYARYFQFLLDHKALAQAEKMIAQYRSAFPGDDVFPVKARALLEYKKGSVEQGLAVYETHFQPLWPQELVQSYFELMTETGSLRKYLDRARASLERNPDDLSAAARIFYYYQRQGRTDAAQQALLEFRLRKERRNVRWTAEELTTLARLNEGIHAYPEAARYYYALYSTGDQGDAQEVALAGLANILLEAPESGVRLGSGEISMYRDIGTIDSGPGFLNGILSLVLNTTSPAWRYSEEEQRAVPYFHRAQAAELLRMLDARFPNSTRRPALHAQLLQAYANYGETDAVIRDGRQFLAAFSQAAEREQAALLLADACARQKRDAEEFAIYDTLLAELAKKADGVPLGAEPGAVQPPQIPVINEEVSIAEAEEGDVEENPEPPQTEARRAFSLQQRKAETASGGARSPEYSRVLERYLSRLVAAKQLPQALTVLRKEIERNPNDPGLYERLAQFLQQNGLGEEQEQVYRRAMQQFQDRSWYHKLARFYLRHQRADAFEQLSQQVVKIFSGTELETYFADVVSPGGYYIRLNEYAHARFPHDLVFVRNLLGAYKSDTPPWERLLREHWWEAEDLRNRFFEFLSRTGRLDQELAALKQMEISAQQGNWPELAKQNSVAARFVAEAGFWRSHFEQAAPLMGAVAQQFPADADLGRRASAAYRSLAAFDPKYTDLAIGVEENLYQADPGNRQTLARMGDILADRELFTLAAPYWERMAQVRPGEARAYLDAASVYWDYYDFDSALRLLNEGRAKLGDPALYSYEQGAIYEGKRDYPAAVREYVQGALREKEASRSHYRLLDLARRPKLRDVVDNATEPLAAGATPDLDPVKLRLAVLEAENRPHDLELFLAGVSERTSSLELLQWLEETTRQKSLVRVQERVLQRQVAVTTDPIRRIELRYALVRFYEGQKDLAAAQRTIEALYAENPKVLGIVRSTVDFYWQHNEKARALEVLLRAANDAYPALSKQFKFEAARKSIDAGQYEPARKLLAQLLADAPYNDEYLAATADTYARAGDDQGLKAFYLQKIGELRKAPLADDVRNRQIAGLRRGLIPALTRLKDYAAAVDQYIEIINRYPEDDALVGEAARYAQDHGRHQQLIAYYRDTAQRSPRDYRWPMVLARMQAQMEDYPAAIDSYAAAIKVRPDRVDLRTARADLLERLTQFEEAAVEYQRLYELNYHDPRWMEQLALLRARQGKVADAVAALEKALIENQPEKPQNYFEVARRLESWDMLPQAREFALRGVDSAGRDLLAVPEHHSGAELYVRILTRLRRHDAAYQRLQTGVADATGLTASVSVTVEQVEKKGIASITDTQWREAALNARRNAARDGMKLALRAMGSAVKQYFTPEEKVNFAAFLDNQAASATRDELAALFLPAAEAAALPQQQARWHERLMLAHFGGSGQGSKNQLVQLQTARMRHDELGSQLERYAQTLDWDHGRSSILIEAAQAYRAGASYDRELQALSAVPIRMLGEQEQRYYQLLLQRRPQQLLQIAGAEQPAHANAATQYAVVHGGAKFAQQMIAARGRRQPPVWTNGYSSLAGLYYADRSPAVQTAFLTTLGDSTIGERIGKPVDRTRQLAGNVWFYYGSRYGEWLGRTPPADPEDFLPALLEQSPASASGYITTAEYYADAGKLARAIQEYNHTLELAPGRADIHDRIAVLYWRQQKRAEAIAEWKQALELLDAQVDQRKVPAGFWPTLSYALNHIGNRHVLTELRPQADAVLRDYVRKNGTYEVNEIVRAAFLATGDPQAGVAWMLDLASVAPDPTSFLTLLVDADWIPATARDPLYQRLLQQIQDRLRSTQGLSQQYAGQDLRSWQLRYARYLIAQRQFEPAAAVLQALPRQPSPSADEVELSLRLAIERNELDALLNQYRANPEQAPPANVMRQAARALQEAGLRTPARKILEYIFAQEIAAHQLTSANVLGLAEIRLQDGDLPGAMDLLRRLTLVVGQPFENLAAAASLLSRTGHPAEAAEFLAQRVKAFPWDTTARVRLAQAQLAAGKQTESATALAVNIAADSAAPYHERVNAAALLAGKATPSLGSAELDLLSRPTVDATAANQAYFYDARIKAAPSAAPAVRVELLRAALQDAPDRDAARVPLFLALITTGQDQLALSAVDPLLKRGFLYAARTLTPSYEPFEQPGDSSEAAVEPIGETPPADAERIAAADRPALALAVGKAFARLKQYDVALRYLQLANNLEKTKSTHADIDKNIAALRAAIRRNANNLLRAPTIHEELEQEHVVRPRQLAPPARSTKSGGAR